MNKAQDNMERFVAKADTSGSCWLWMGGRLALGYGRFKVGRKTLLAHRVSYSLFLGEIPEGLFVCHKCDVRHCVNPDHLFLGTHQDNMDDMNNKGRGVAHIGERNGSSKLTQAQVDEIRARYVHGDGLKLSEEFGVSRSAISLIISGSRWKKAANGLCEASHE